MARNQSMLPIILLSIFSIILFSSAADQPKPAGKLIFFDKNLSVNKNQSCEVCHGQKVGWTGPDEQINKHGSVYEGSIAHHFGNRKPPSSAYATLVPIFNYDPANGFTGGNFWDGRATGWKLGNAAADQAQGPPLNPLEQGFKSIADIVSVVCNASYSDLFKNMWKDSACNDSVVAFNNIARSIEHFESSLEVNKFNSKYDLVQQKKANFTKLEAKGLSLFTGKARCSQCHTVTSGNEPHALFTNFSYHNIGIPKNPENPFYHMDTIAVDGKIVNPDGSKWIDPGLGGFLDILSKTDDWRNEPFVPQNIKQMTKSLLSELANVNYGKHRVPTLRNVNQRPTDLFVKAYTHNGYFKSLKTLVHFYNTRDILARCSSPMIESQALAKGCWPPPEVSANLNKSDTGNLGLSSQEEDAIVAFLKTLSDSL
jgi:cytochrome c peroxidase